MSKIEELKVAFAHAAPGEWERSGHATPAYAPQYGVYVEGGRELAIVRGDVEAEFITLAHNLMPQLLKAASLVLECEALVREYPYIHQECKKVLEALQ